MAKTREQIIKAVSDVYPPGGWIFLSCSEEYDFAAQAVNEFVQIKNELDYDDGTEPPEENSRMFGDIRVFGRPRYDPGEGKVFILGEATDKDLVPEKLAVTDHYFTWLATESTVEMFLFFGKIDGELAAMIKGFDGNVPLFFMDVEPGDVIKHFPDLQYARPDLADPQFLSPGWVSSIRNDYSYFSYSTACTVPMPPPEPQPMPQPVQEPLPVGATPPVQEPEPETPPEPEETPAEKRKRKRALRYDERYRQ